MSDVVPMLSFPAKPKPPKKPWTSSMHMGVHMFQDLSQESLEEYKAEFKEYEKAFIKWMNECNEVATLAARMLISRGFPDSGIVRIAGSARNQDLVKILRGCGPMQTSAESLWVAEEERWLRESVCRENENKSIRDKTALRDRAIKFLLERGKVYGIDFVAEDAPQKALDIVASEIIDKRSGQWNSFSGQNCEEPCSGWDGIARRCKCGNRRVSWTIEGTFESPSVYGEAY
jgi:hypothetical protein